MKNFLSKPKKCFDDCDADSFRVKKLPENFAETVLNLELDIEQPDISLESVNQLIELYACAVEYYESIHSDRFLIFQNKMKNLLLKPNVVSIMERSSPGLKKSESQSPELKKMQKLKELEMNLLIGKQQLDNQKVISLLKDQSKKIEDLSSLVKSETSKQQADIMQRLLNRKNKQLEKSKKEKMLDTIVNIVSKKDIIQGRRISRALDTNVLEKEYYGTDENISPSSSQNSPANWEQRKKSIAMLKRASQDLTAIVEKRMSKLNVLEIEKAVQMNRVNSIKKHFNKNTEMVMEEEKKDESDSSDSDDDSDTNTAMEQSNATLQSPVNKSDPQRDSNLIKLKAIKSKEKEIESKSSVNSKIDDLNIESQPLDNNSKTNINEVNLQENTKNTEKSELDEKENLETNKINDVQEKNENSEEVEQKTVKTIENPNIEEIKNEDSTAQAKEKNEANINENEVLKPQTKEEEEVKQEIIIEKTLEINENEPINKIIDKEQPLQKEEIQEETKIQTQQENKEIENSNLQEYERESNEVTAKFSDKIALLENQILSSGGQSKLLQKMLDQVKKERDNEILKIKEKYNIIEKKNEKKLSVLSPNKASTSNENKEIKEINKKESQTNQSLNEMKASVKENETKIEQASQNNDALDENKIKQLEKEKDEKIKSVLAKFGNQISQLEAQIKQNKSGGGLMAKLLEKLKKEELNQMEAINKEYDEKMNLKL